jgi:hypothetical protein
MSAAAMMPKPKKSAEELKAKKQQGETEYKDKRLKRLLELYRMKPQAADEFKSICVEISYWLTRPSLNSIRKQQQRRRNRERYAVKEPQAPQPDAAVVASRAERESYVSRYREQNVVCCAA